MKHTVLLAAALAALSLAGCNSEPAPATDAATTDAMAEGMASETPSMPAASTSSAQAFANAAAASDQFEIESSKLAASKAQSDEVKRFAEQMIKAHTDSTAKLKTAASQASPAITPAPQMTPMQQQTLSDLGAKSGAEFDEAYSKAQVDAHQMTLDTLKAYSADGEVEPLKQFATELVPIVTAHLNMAKGL